MSKLCRVHGSGHFPCDRKPNTNLFKLKKNTYIKEKTYICLCNWNQRFIRRTCMYWEAKATCLLSFIQVAWSLKVSAWLPLDQNDQSFKSSIRNKGFSCGFYMGSRVYSAYTGHHLFQWSLPETITVASERIPPGKALVKCLVSCNKRDSVGLCFVLLLFLKTVWSWESTLVS